MTKTSSNLRAQPHDAPPDEQTPLYNSRIIKVYIDYLSVHHPLVSIEEVLEYAGISSYSVDDQAHWFSQTQVDRFNDIVVKKTGIADIARHAGRFAVSSGKLGALQQYLLGFMGVAYVYLLMGKLYGIMSRGAVVTAKKLRGNKVEIISRPATGVHEKTFQCENRLGTFESLTQLFSNELAEIAHPECKHRGDEHCRYIISWKRTATMNWRLARNLLSVFSVPLLVTLYFHLSLQGFTLVALLNLLVVLVLDATSTRTEKKELTDTIAAQGDAAKDLLEEINVRHANSSLAQEIGQTLSKTLDVKELTHTVVRTIVKRTKFDRALIMLVNRERNRLIYQAGYGYSDEQKALLMQSQFHLDRPQSKGPFVLAFNDKTPFLIEDLTKSLHKLSRRSRELTTQLSVKSLICAPILFQNEALGILAVDNEKSKAKFDESDLHLVVAVASQTAAGITNANSFKQLEASEKEYRQLVESAKSIILRMDREGNITFFNDFAQRFFGYTESEILGKNILSTIVIRSESNLRDFENLTSEFQENSHQKIVRENEHVLQDGSRCWITWTYNPIFDDNGEFNEILCIGSDITELKRASEEKQELALRLQRAEKMEALGTLAGGVAHDLNNILAGVVTYPQALLMGLSADAEHLRKPLESISTAGEKAAAIVHDLLTLARRGVTKLSVLDLNELVTEFLRDISYANVRVRHSKVAFTHAIEKESLHVMGSAFHLNKVMMNLITNAAEAINESGHVHISTSHRHLKKVLQGYENIPAGEYAVLSVQDDGIGISPNDMERIFEPFYTKKVMSRSGTGLGMAVVWGTVKDHGGYIDFHTVQGEGTTFQIYFPVTEQVPEEEQPFNLSDFMGGGETILVVDDVKEQRDIAFQMLTRLGYRVVTVPNGRKALEYLAKNKVHLLVLDMIMDSEWDGLETYRKILELHPNQRAIIASGFSETDRVKEAQRLGAGAYIRKPYTLEMLATAVKRETQPPRDPTIIH